MTLLVGRYLFATRMRRFGEYKAFPARSSRCRSQESRKTPALIEGDLQEARKNGRARMRPGQERRFTTFRGEHRSAEWEETAERFYLFELIWAHWRRKKFQNLKQR
ncbi:hypothetical protein OHD62_08460 [Mesorhizobium sp. YC-39]|uniref:hypothetical protein n=1 Tax=unclassified Mesorhizobium TaxID=325217 RepID=UPI0021E6F763|nr:MULTISPECIES: hypothetical protein [unclassified Mesorhizobium]MCV3205205.1 hypothetical protein [Mesorhizobium sp. YC-2]MCV3228396.1 hypothetical protein [Mesorhizobium sp. YC-39]